MNYDSPSELDRVLAARGLALKKRFGQNFLVNRGVREKIIDRLGIKPGETVWEIGPGLGAMTALVLERAGRTIVFEIDGGFVRALQEFFGDREGFEVVEGDAVKRLGEVRDRTGTPDRVLGNLPYSSASQIIAAFIEHDIAARRITITVQKELAGRMRAAPGSKNYSSFSVLCRSFFRIDQEFDLKGGNFHPRPEVDSTVVSLTPDFRLPPGPAREFFFALIRLAFASRRKTIANNLLRPARLPDERQAALRAFFARRGISESARAEELSPDVFIAAAIEASAQA